MAFQAAHLAAGGESPQADGLVGAAGQGQAAVRGDGHGRDFGRVPREGAELASRPHVPQAEELVLDAAGEDALAVRGEGGARGPAIVALELLELSAGRHVPQAELGHVPAREVGAAVGCEGGVVDVRRDVLGVIMPGDPPHVREQALGEGLDEAGGALADFGVVAGGRGLAQGVPGGGADGQQASARGFPFTEFLMAQPADESFNLPATRFTAFRLGRPGSDDGGKRQKCFGPDRSQGGAERQ
jgi:hypothetical protein